MIDYHLTTIYTITLYEYDHHLHFVLENIDIAYNCFVTFSTIRIKKLLTPMSNFKLVVVWYCTKASMNIEKKLVTMIIYFPANLYNELAILMEYKTCW